MPEPVVLGIDPDSKLTAWAAVSGSKFTHVGIIRTPKADSTPELLRLLVPALDTVLNITFPDLVVVEGQQFYHGGKAPPEDILKLANIAGGIAGIIRVLDTGPRIAIPTPKDWKGQTPKPINQTRSYAHYGILSALASGYAYPTGCKLLALVRGASNLNKGDWKHAGDSLGLARFGAEKLL